MIQNGSEKRKSRYQDKEDIILSLIIMYIHIKVQKSYVKLHIYNEKLVLKNVFTHDLKADKRENIAKSYLK